MAKAIVINLENSIATTLATGSVIRKTGHGTMAQWIDSLKAAGYDVKAGYNARHLIIGKDGKSLLSIHFNKGTRAEVWFRKAGRAMADTICGTTSEALVDGTEVGAKVYYSQLAKAIF